MEHFLSTSRSPASRLRLARIVVLLAALAASGVSGCAGASVQSSDVDFGGNGLSHGHP